MTRPRGPAGAAGVVLWCATPAPTVGAAAAVLSPAEHRRAAAFRLAADRERFVTARVLVRAAAGEVLGCRPAEVGLRVDGPRDPAPGRPFVPGGPAVSIAHAGARVLVAVLDLPGAQVGTDVEAVAAVAAHRDGLRDAVAEAERPPGGWTPAALARAWVRREAVLKAVGTGLLVHRDDLVLGRADGPAAVRSTRPPLPPADTLRVRDVVLPAAPAGAGGHPAGPDGHRAAVAVHLPGGGELAVAVADATELLARAGAPAA